jgi:hypothetical protein
MNVQNRKITQLNEQRTAIHPAPRRLGATIVSAFALTLAIYGMAEWLYVAVCSLIIPAVLPLPLTHLLPFLREDTSGVISFALSFFGFALYRILRDI